jgi:hypothetical protein
MTSLSTNEPPTVDIKPKQPIEPSVHAILFEILSHPIFFEFAFEITSSEILWLGSTYCRRLARCSVKRPTASHTTEIDRAADEFLSDNPDRGGYGMHVPGA